MMLHRCIDFWLSHAEKDAPSIKLPISFKQHAAVEQGGGIV